ncbi:MAG TPA: 2-dehydro-3-deoxyphosphooctonate aldolase, partial [Paracoccus sp. (in: a-proteobacteria)]|nr:2-dehydro-3-deoxyphosphooctonate aldolase [Paracoccus sp. (in: a-proteobacteria)]
DKLFNTAYVLACDVAASDGRAGGIETEMLAEIRDQLDIDRLHAGAIEFAARARHRGL